MEIIESVPHPNHCSYPLRKGNKVVPLIDSRATYERICEVIDKVLSIIRLYLIDLIKAKKRVWVAVSFLQKEWRAPGERGSFFDLMDSCVARGLDVRVLFWNNSKFALG